MLLRAALWCVPPNKINCKYILTRSDSSKKYIITYSLFAIPETVVNTHLQLSQGQIKAGAEGAAAPRPHKM